MRQMPSAASLAMPAGTTNLRWSVIQGVRVGSCPLVHTFAAACTQWGAGTKHFHRHSQCYLCPQSIGASTGVRNQYSGARARPATPRCAARPARTLTTPPAFLWCTHSRARRASTAALLSPSLSAMASNATLSVDDQLIIYLGEVRRAHSHMFMHACTWPWALGAQRVTLAAAHSSCEHVRLLHQGSRLFPPLVPPAGPQHACLNCGPVLLYGSDNCPPADDHQDSRLVHDHSRHHGRAGSAGLCCQVGMP